MSYSLQTFSSGQVFTSGQAQQIEFNIRDHRHGVDGVGISGASFEVTSKGAAFSVASTDGGKMYTCYGDYQVDFATAGTLGANHATAFKNVGSGRIVLAAAVGGYIEGSSYFCLTPGETVIAQSGGDQIHLTGNVHGPARLARILLTSSMAQIDLTRMYPGDFARYELLLKPQLNSLGVVMLRYSVDSGSTFVSANYTDTYGTGNSIRIGGANMNSAQCAFAICRFKNDETSMSVVMNIEAIRLTATTPTEERQIGANTALFGMINALRIIAPASTAGANVGSMQSGSVFELWGYGRPRITV